MDEKALEEAARAIVRTHPNYKTWHMPGDEPRRWQGYGGGMMGKCVNCRFWSEMCARAMGGGPVEALCLAEGGPKQGKYTAEHDGCNGFKPNSYGAIDDPPNYGEEVRRLYVEEEGETALKAREAQS